MRPRADLGGWGGAGRCLTEPPWQNIHYIKFFKKFYVHTQILNPLDTILEFTLSFQVQLPSTNFLFEVTLYCFDLSVLTQKVYRLAQLKARSHEICFYFNSICNLHNSFHAYSSVKIAQNQEFEDVIDIGYSGFYRIN